MVAINFSPRFAPLVASGAKLQTIRRSARCKPGDRLQLYTGQRTMACRKLVSPDPVCVLVDYCAVRSDGLTFGNKALHEPHADDFARADGFRDYDDMLAWFLDRYGPGEFVGKVIKWAATPGQV